MIGYEFEFLVREGDKPLTEATFLKFHEELKRRIERRENPAQELLKIWKKTALPAYGNPVIFDIPFSSTFLSATFYCLPTALVC